MQIRAIHKDDLDVFTNYSENTEQNAALREYILELWDEGASRPEWSFVAEAHGQVLGRVAYWGLSSSTTPSHVEILELPWAGDYPAVGKELLRQSLASLHAQGATTIEYNLHNPSQRDTFPEKRVEVLEQAGFSLVREGLRFEWLDTGQRVIVPDRLVFRPLLDVGQDVFIATLQRILDNSLDRWDQLELAKLGPAGAAQQHFQNAQALKYEPAWWQLGYRDEQVVGLLMPAENDGGPIIEYIGVVPEERGRGYIDDLLAQATATLQSAGATRIRADTDVQNVPMAAAFRRIGYQQFRTRLDYNVDSGMVHQTHSNA